MDLYEELQKYAMGGIYPMCMPGHKRNSDWKMGNPYSMDITEIEGFDNLHAPEGLLLEAEKRAAALYGSDSALYLINGSTAGILIAVSAAALPGQKILIARNSHKSVYHAAYLRHLKIEYLYPEIDKYTNIPGSICPEEVERGLAEHPEAALVVITSPTYEGILSDLKTISELVHERGKLLLVDAAHGAHLGFHPYFPEHALRAGADLVVQSLHKTLPAFTQTALLHWNRQPGQEDSNREMEERLRKFSGIYQSSSPSYLLMAGIERCICFLQTKANKTFEEYAGRLQWFYQETKQLRHLKVLSPEADGGGAFFGRDPGKLVILSQGLILFPSRLPEKVRRSLEGQQVNIAGRMILTGKLLYELLLGYAIQPEMAMEGYVLCMTSLCDTKEGFTRLAEGLREIDSCCEERERSFPEFDSNPLLRRLPRMLELFETEGRTSKSVPLQESEGYTSAEFIYLYPPGIPYVVPGEVLDAAAVEQLLKCSACGLQLKGMADQEGKVLKVIEVSE